MGWQPNCLLKKNRRVGRQVYRLMKPLAIRLRLSKEDSPLVMPTLFRLPVGTESCPPVIDFKHNFYENKLALDICICTLDLQNKLRSQMQVSMREFKSHLSQYIEQAQAGDSIELTSYRKVVARIVGVPPTESTGRARLLAAGVARWKEGKPEGAMFKLQPGGKLISALVLEDRG
jgi:antitoxin (DNA-binding transcriptional repressor) of toxin-antitoxin stability system